MRSIPIVQLGIGNVGMEVIRNVLDFNKSNPGNSYRFIGVANSKSILFREERISENVISEIQAGSALPFTLKHSDSIQHSGDLSPLKDYLDQLNLPDLVLIDTTDSSSHLPLLLTIAERGVAMVFANKKPLVQDMSAFRKLNQVQPGYRATVGAGLPVIPELEKLLSDNQKIHKIEGCFSGSLGILCSSMEAGRQFSTLVKELMQKGYTEPDPRLDLSGIDMANKIMILSRLCGYDIELNNIAIKSLFPSGLVNLSTKEFLSNLTSLDDEFSARFRELNKKNTTLRFVATLEDGLCRVGLKEVSRDSEIGRLQGAEKLAIIHTVNKKDTPRIIKGSGAGAKSAARDVFNDLLHLRYRDR